MNRREFIESHGATCSNWTWSWSFVNHAQRFVIFGAWDAHTEGNRTLILSREWEIRRGRKRAAFGQSLEHLRLVQEEGYALRTFSMKRGAPIRDGPARILGFEPDLRQRSLVQLGDNWYACDATDAFRLPDEIEGASFVTDGAVTQILVNRYERSSDGRKKCLAAHGYACRVCDFDFERVYGEIGRGYIHVHHIKPLGEIRSAYELCPETDLVPVCPNCHAMIHATTPALTVEQLRALLRRDGV